MSDTEIVEINALVVDIERETTVEIALVVVPSLDESIFTTAQELFDAWKIGKDDKDNGMLIIAAIEDCDFRTHTGYGLEGIFTDAAISFLQESIVVPEFKEERYAAGILNYLRKIQEILRDPESLAEVRSSAERNQNLTNFSDVAIPVFVFGGAGILMLIGALVALIREIISVFERKRKNFDAYSAIASLEGKAFGKNGFGVSVFLFPFGAVFFAIALGISGLFAVHTIVTFGALLPVAGLLVSLAAMAWSASIKRAIIHRWRHDARACPKCSSTMKKLSEKDDDRYLAPFQITEEKIQSEDYDVWLCESCGATTVEKFRAGKYSLFVACPSCQSLAAHQTKRQIVSAPTYVSTGELVLHFECLACAHTFKISTVIPMLTRSSSSGSGFGSSSHSSSHSSGSSFGGGRSGGGGSTSHW